MSVERNLVKPWTIILCVIVGVILFGPFYSSLEGAMKLKLGPFCSS